ncbi:MAG: PmoA family protein [Planctomycetaceae bacterium]|jgi:hypothetical protein|nr:PmoA family protein [Planctomycetaceae bacterium]
MKHSPLFLVLSMLLCGSTFGDDTLSAAAPSPVYTELKSDGKLIAEYRYADAPYKPYIVTLRTPSGKNILRDAPHDHKHHHALMFALAVNGTNFWEEISNAGKEITNDIAVQPSSLKSGLVWQNAAGKVLLKEDRTISVTGSPEVTLLDWQSVLKHPTDLPNDPPVDFDKSAHHYYGLGIRFDQSMDKQGVFFNSTGKNEGTLVRGDERLTPCHWTACTAKLHGESVTVAVFGNPKNPVPTLAFTMGDRVAHFKYIGISMNFHREPRQMQPKETMTFNFRVAVWDGEVSPETVEKEYQKSISP